MLLGDKAFGLGYILGLIDAHSPLQRDQGQAFSGADWEQFVVTECAKDSMLKLHELIFRFMARIGHDPTKLYWQRGGK